MAFARALAPNPQVLLLDEPFAAIDAKIRQELRSWLKEMIGKLGITSIFVTHDQDEAIEVADEIIITNAGRIEQKGTPIGVYRNPETAFTASFFGQPSVLKNADDFHTFAQAEGADKIIVRPEFVKISKLDEVETLLMCNRFKNLFCISFFDTQHLTTTFLKKFNPNHTHQ